MLSLVGLFYLSCDHVRADDSEEVLRERLQAYEEQTLPLFDGFRKRGQATDTVDGSLPEDEVTERIFELLDRR